jgi:hypothetical protein
MITRGLGWNRRVGRLFFALALLTSLHAQPFPGYIGVGIGNAAEGARSRAFVDLGKVFRPFTLADGSTPAPADANGWPAADGQAIFFDIRPLPTDAPAADDPAQFQPDWSGTYHMSFNGQATLSGSGFAPVNQAYDAGTNTTTADIAVPAGTGLLLISFTNTKRTAASPTNSGVTNIKLIRPGYDLKTSQVFTSEFLKAIAPFSTLRFTGFTDTNNADPDYQATDNQTHWTDRHTPADATQQQYGRKTGFAWEYAIQLANTAHKNLWINIPISADSDYIVRVARLLLDQLDDGLVVYVESSNEVWNPRWKQHDYNLAAAQAEVAKGGSLLNKDGNSDPEEWARRRHAKRLVEIVGTFASVWGGEEINSTIRGVYSWWGLHPEQYDGVLSWVSKTFGDPSNVFYAAAQGHSFSDSQAAPDASVADILTAMGADSDAGMNNTATLAQIAHNWLLGLFAYAAGPDSGTSTDNVGNRILANRDAGIADLMIHDVRDNWFHLGGSLYMYSDLSDPYSRFGPWGLTDDIVNLNTYKFQAVDQLLGLPQ